MQNSSDLVSVIVPSFNSAAYLPELCRSLHLQTYKHFEVLIGDDGSTDQTLDAVSPFLKDRRFFYFREKTNLGVTQMTLNLLKKARGGYWCYPGADDAFLPDFLRNRLGKLKKRKTTVLVHGPPLFIDERGKDIPNPWPTIKPDKVTPAGRTIKQLLQHNFINTPSVLIRMDATKQVIPLMIKHWQYAQDWFLWILLAATGGDFVYDRAPLNKYRIHLNSLSKQNDYSINRKMETRLVPLLALKTIKRIPSISKNKLIKYERSLNSLWIYRYLTIRLKGMQKQKQIEDLYFKQIKVQKPNLSEILREIPHLVRLSFLNIYYKRAQKLFVSGLPEINDPIFKK